MFGLDARIALAIFGALSVISGAALYSAIQQSKVIQAVTSLNEIKNAYDSYFLDTNSEIALDSSYSYGVFIELKKLIEDSTAGWSGPYLSENPHSTLTHLAHNSLYENSYLFIARVKDTEWGDGSSNSTTSQACDLSNPCFIWVGMTQVPFELAKAIDEYIDGIVDFKTGNIRVNDVSSDYQLFWKHRVAI